MSFKWLFLSLGSDWKTRELTFGLFSREILSKKIEKKKELKEKKAKEKKPKRKPNLFVLWQERMLLAKIMKVLLVCLVNMLKKIRFDKFALDSRIATPDPAVTGMLYGGICGLVYSFGFSPSNQQIRIVPDFETTLPKASVELGLKTKVRDVFYCTSKLFFSLPKIKMIKLFKKAYKRRR